MKLSLPLGIALFIFTCVTNTSDTSSENMRNPANIDVGDAQVSSSIDIRKSAELQNEDIFIHIPQKSIVQGLQTAAFTDKDIAESGSHRDSTVSNFEKKPISYKKLTQTGTIHVGGSASHLTISLITKDHKEIYIPGDALENWQWYQYDGKKVVVTGYSTVIDVKDFRGKVFGQEMHYKRDGLRISEFKP